MAADFAKALEIEEQRAQTTEQAEETAEWFLFHNKIIFYRNDEIELENDENEDKTTWFYWLFHKIIFQNKIR